MPTAFKIRQVEFVFTLVPTGPLVAVLESAKAVEALFGAFGEFGLRASDVRVENRGNSLGELQYQCWLFNSRVLVTVRIDAIEVWIGSDQVPTSVPVLAAAAANLAHALGASSIRSKQLATRFHGELEGISASDWLASKIGGEIGRTWKPTTSVFELTEGGVKASALLEESRLVEGGLFLGMVLSISPETDDRAAAENAGRMFRLFASVVDLAAEGAK